MAKKYTLQVHGYTELGLQLLKVYELQEFNTEIFGDIRIQLQNTYSRKHPAVALVLERWFPTVESEPIGKISVLSFTRQNDFFELESDELFFNHRYIGDTH